MMNARSRLAFFVAVAVHALLVSQAAHADPPVPRIQWSDSCPPAPPGSGYGDDGQQCAMIEVPLDYRRPNGDRISIAVSMIPAASPAQRRGVLFLNPGGPGGAGLDMPRMMVSLLGGGPGQAVLDRYDLIGSLLGICAFTALSFLHAPSVVWGFIAFIFYLVLTTPSRRLVTCAWALMRLPTRARNDAPGDAKLFSARPRRTFQA